jgi:hypothetical protein
MFVPKKDILGIISKVKYAESDKYYILSLYNFNLLFEAPL